MCCNIAVSLAPHTHFLLAGTLDSQAGGLSNARGAGTYTRRETPRSNACSSSLMHGRSCASHWCLKSHSLALLQWGSLCRSRQSCPALLGVIIVRTMCDRTYCWSLACVVQLGASAGLHSAAVSQHLGLAGSLCVAGGGTGAPADAVGQRAAHASDRHQERCRLAESGGAFDNVFVERGVASGGELLTRLARLRGLLADPPRRPVRLLIIDSIAHLFRDAGAPEAHGPDGGAYGPDGGAYGPGGSGAGAYGARAAALFRLAALLKRYADEFGLAVVVTNQARAAAAMPLSTLQRLWPSDKAAMHRGSTS